MKNKRKKKLGSVRSTTSFVKYLFLAAIFVVGLVSVVLYTTPFSSPAQLSPASKKVLGVGTKKESPVKNRQIKTVFLIVMENASFSEIFHNASAPFINTFIIPQAAYATNYHSPDNLHPSEPNYVWLEAGSNQLEDKTFTTDDDPNLNNSSNTANHLVSLLDKKGITWKAYIENIDGAGCPTKSNGLYAAKHNPMIFFQDVTNDASYCISHMRPFSQLYSDLSNNSVASYNILEPNVCDDMHTLCSGHATRIQQGDEWLSQQIPVLMKSQAYQDGGMIAIVWDEAEDDKSSPIGLFILSPFAKKGYISNEPFTHSSLLKTIEEIFGINPLLRDSTNANDFHSFFVVSPI